MRCRQARKKLIELVLARVPLDRDNELMEHLSRCLACAAQAETAIALDSDLKSAREHDNSDTVPWPVLRSRIEARAVAQIKKREKEKSIMAGIINRARKRPRVSIGVAAFAVVVILSLIIPIKYDKTVGYEVAFAGVDKNLAMDGDKIALLLDKLGVDDAEVDVTDCDTTCKVYIKKLKSPDDANLVIAAFSDIDNVELLENVRPILESSSGNIIKIMAHTITFTDRHLESMQKARQMVMERLGDSIDCNEFIWLVNDENDSLLQIDIHSCTDQAGNRQNIIYISKDDTSLTEDGQNKLFINCFDPAKNPDIICLPPDGSIDDSTLKRLQSMGLQIVAEDSPDGAAPDPELWIMRHDSADQEAENVSKDAALVPDEFELSQNYPNPFNPDTRIDYFIPTSQHVTLEIINTNGQLVRTLIDAYQESGRHSVEWDATDENGREVATGVYMYRIKAGDFADTKKMSFIK